MSVIDLLFNEGPRSREIVMSGNDTREQLLGPAAPVIGDGSMTFSSEWEEIYSHGMQTASGHGVISSVMSCATAPQWRIE